MTNQGDELVKALYQKYFWKVVRFFMHVFRVAEQDAKDLAQDTFLKFQRSAGNYRGEAEWAYLEKVARSVALNRIRAMGARRRSAITVNLDDPEMKQELVAPAGPDYAERQELADRIRRMNEEIAKLPPNQRRCIELRLEGFTYDEIARSLRISMDAVKSRLRDAMRTLRAKLGDDNVLPEDEQ